ncbi:hypothetical protein ABG067_006243 [Albugo candida]|uniref:Uncharacterized protein n=1 Tax=Albugo candida TaxID=65357 RepID=A0A024FVV2_9STRA|nr:unnamed protein product [Albugo candida]|eukprot:CCI11260.1 unnamed protein product [Albugo candida]
MSHASRGPYYCSMLLGPEHIDTTQFFFHIGSILNNYTRQPAESSSLDSKDKGLGMLNKVIHICQKCRREHECSKLSQRFTRNTMGVHNAWTEEFYMHVA